VAAPIVVEVYAPAPRPAELAALLAACSRAAAPKECVSSDAKSAEPPLGVAIVRRDAERARIELGLRSAPSAEWSTRDLVFQPGDDELERYRAIGFAIGTLVAGQREPPSPPPASEPSTETESEPLPPPLPTPKAERVVRREPAQPEESEAEPEPRSSPATHGSRGVWVDAAGSLGLGLIPGPPRAGAALRGAVEILPHSFFVVVEGGYAESVGNESLRVRWQAVGGGLGHPLAPRLRSFGVDLRLLVAFERLLVTATEGNLSESGARWKPGVTAAIDGYWNVAPPLGLLLTASTFIDPRPTVVRSLSQEVGETPALGLSGFVGVRIKVR
jgi:hypothetical protein